MIAADFYRLHASGQWLRTVLAALAGAAGVAYFAWRVTVLNPEAPVLSAVFLLAELFGFLSLALTVAVCWRISERRAAAAPARATVDVFIPTYDEPVEMVRLTAAAALAMRHPHETWLLDDGNRAEIRALAVEFGCRYLARDNNAFAKAGNLNHALERSRGEFIALLDADHVPEAGFLEALLGYFADPEVAFAQAPHEFYNHDSVQNRNDARHGTLWHDQSFFYRAGEAGRDHWNAASFCGTTAMLRRSALERVGGFATQTVTEDMHTAVRLHKLGCKSVFHPEPLAYGVGAVDFVEFLQQRIRWGHGNVQVLREEGLPFCKGLGWMQRLCYTSLGLTYFEGWIRLVLYLTPPVVLVAGVAPITDTRWLFWFFLPYFTLACLLVQEMGRGMAPLVATEKVAMARFPAYMLAAIGLVARRRHWRITSKLKGKRVPVVLLAPQGAVLAANLAGLGAVALGVSPALQSLTTGTVVAVCLWAAFHAWIAAEVILNVRRDVRRAPVFQFPLSLPLEAQAAVGAPVAHCRTVLLDPDNVEFEGPRGLHAASALRLGLYLAGQRFEVEAVVTDSEAIDPDIVRIEARLRWGTALRERDAFNRLLHACSWHRLTNWPGTHVPTPIERALSAFGIALRGVRVHEAQWRAVLYRESRVHGPWRLGLLRSAAQGHDLITFDRAEPEHVTVLDPVPGHPAALLHLVRDPHRGCEQPLRDAHASAWRELKLLRSATAEAYAPPASAAAARDAHA